MSAQDPRLNRFLAAAKPSATYGVMARVAEKRAEGANIISLCAGEPDFDTPEHIADAGVQAIRSGHTRYTPVAGIRPLREAIGAKFQGENNMDVHWRDTIVCSGGKQVIFNALAATMDEGDEVIIPAPYWVSYPEIVQLCGGVTVSVPCPASSGFKMTPDSLQAAITVRTKWLILNSPSNPTGAVYSHDDLLALAEVLLAHPNILVLSDDIYEHLIFDGLPFHTMAEIEPRLKERILTMNGVSKAYAMTGWRIGYGAGPSWLIEAIEKLQGQQTSGACTISQHAALAALIGPQDYLTSAREIFQRRRDMVVQLLNEAKGLDCPTPQGAFYAFPSCKGLLGKTSPAGRNLETDEDVAAALLDEAGVAVVHGSAFGMAGYFRVAYALDDVSLRKACVAIGDFCARTQ